MGKTASKDTSKDKGVPVVEEVNDINLNSEELLFEPAEKARSKTATNICLRVNDILKSIEEEINRSVGQCNYSCEWVISAITEELMTNHLTLISNYLIARGYIVSVTNEPNTVVASPVDKTLVTFNKRIHIKWNDKETIPAHYDPFPLEPLKEISPAGWTKDITKDRITLAVNKILEEIENKITEASTNLQFFCRYTFGAPNEGIGLQFESIIHNYLTSLGYELDFINITGNTNPDLDFYKEIVITW